MLAHQRAIGWICRFIYNGHSRLDTEIHSCRSSNQQRPENRQSEPGMVKLQIEQDKMDIPIERLT